jgi:nitrate reductase gamma subunit
MIDTLLFGIFPYVAVILAVVVAIYRYTSDRFSYSALSTQFLESRQLFWASVPWHYAILIVLLAHLIVFVAPSAWAVVVGVPAALYTVEVIGLALGLAATISVALFIVRRMARPRLKVVTSPMDWLLLAALLLQVALGVYVALAHRWGAVWSLETAVPWLWSLARLDPQVQYVAVLPWLAKLHMFNAFVLVALFPFTRLVHIFTVPITYLWRPHQVVIWYRRATSR